MESNLDGDRVAVMERLVKLIIDFLAQIRMNCKFPKWLMWIV